jgi:serine/threonine protein kinase
MWTFPEESSLHTEAASAPPPDAFGPFRVLHQIGAGALGPVFRAYEPERDRLVAVKLFRLDLPPERVHQLVAEFEQLIVADLGYPTIAAPRATGIAGVCAYLAQDYVAADSLDIVVRESGPAPAADALRVAAQLADALDFAAAREIVHGALHPRDVLLSKDDLRIVGLGVTRALERVGGAAPVRRPYTAPERIGGGAWDRRADVFSLAAVVHELLWGRRLSGSGAQAAETLTETPGGDLVALRQVFARALAEDMTDRFATATEFAQALSGAFGVVATIGLQPPPGRPSRAAPRSAPVTKVRRPVAEPMLPLDSARGAGDAEGGGGNDHPEPDLALQARPAPEPDPESEPVEPLLTGRVLFSPAPVRSSSQVWPLALAGIIGAALGFGAGYATAIRDRPSAAPAVAAAASNASVPAVGRDFTEGRVNEPVSPPAPKPSAPKPVAPPAPKAEQPFGGRVLVRSSPAGAHVFVDGQARGDTPATVRDLNRGAHQVRLVRDGYTTVDRRIVVSASSPVQSLVVKMALIAPVAPAAGVRTAPGNKDGALVVESRPAGAKVFVDGREVGTTPLSLPRLAAGEHAIHLEREGYQRWSSSVRVVASEQNRVTASLER